MSAGAGLIAAGMLQLQSPQLREAGEGLPAPVPNPRQCWPSEGVRRGLYLFKMVLFYIVGIEVIVVEIFLCCFLATMLSASSTSLDARSTEELERARVRILTPCGFSGVVIAAVRADVLAALLRAKGERRSATGLVALLRARGESWRASSQATLSPFHGLEVGAGTSSLSNWPCRPFTG